VAIVIRGRRGSESEVERRIRRVSLRSDPGPVEAGTRFPHRRPSYRGFLKRNVDGLEERVAGGTFVLADGTAVGTHSGYPFYTIGQRKGLGVSHAEPLYVLNVVAETNTVVVGYEDDLLVDGLTADSLNMMKYDNLDEGRECNVKIRYKDNGAPAWCETNENGSLTVRFQEPRRAINRGQSVVLYDGDDVVGGGIITGSLKN